MDVECHDENVLALKQSTGLFMSFDKIWHRFERSIISQES